MNGVTLYSDMTPDVASAARAAAERIRVHMLSATAALIEVGRELLEIKSKLSHGQFLPWVEAEFEMSERSARNLMRVAEEFGSKSAKFADLPKSVLYALAAPSTPEPVRDEIVRLAAAGETVTVDTVMDLKRQLVDAKDVARDAKQDVKVQRSEAQRAKDDRDRARIELDFANSKLRQQAEEIERLKQDGVIHVYPAEPRVGPSPSIDPPRTKPYSFLSSIAALIADGCRRDVEEIVSMLRAEGLYGLASELETASEKHGEAA